MQDSLQRIHMILPPQVRTVDSRTFISEADLSAAGPVGRNMEHGLRTELAEEEATAELDGIAPIHEVSPSSFIASILELEEQQYVL